MPVLPKVKWKEMVEHIETRDPGTLLDCERAILWAAQRMDEKSMNNECEHGQLATSCNICDYEKEIAELQAENDAWAEKWLAERKENDKWKEAATVAVHAEGLDAVYVALEALAALVDGKQDG